MTITDLAPFIIVSAVVLYLLGIVIWAIYRSRRIDRACNFLCHIIDLADASSRKLIKEDAPNWQEPWEILMRLDYGKVYDGIKSLKLKYYFTAEEIAILTYGQNYKPR